MATKQPNIVLILADDMGYSDLGCFGSEIQTPNIDSMAEKGISYTSMYNCARCCPSRASLLTGLYPHKAGIGHMTGNLGTEPYQGYLRNDCVTIAETLRQGGYRTLISGKWHVGGGFDPLKADTWTPGDNEHPTPLQRGFDKFFGIFDGACSYFHPHHLMEGDERLIPDPEGFYLTDEISNQAVTMIEESVQEDQPFFLYLPYTAPHWPLHAHPEDIDKYKGIYNKGWDEIRTSRHEKLQSLGILDKRWDISPRDKGSIPWDEVKDPEWEASRMAVYAAQVESMDKGIGSVLNTLRTQGIEENTIVIFMSDNGGCAEFMAEDGWASFYPALTPDGQKINLGNHPDVSPGGPLTFMSYDLPWANVSNTPFRLFKHWVHEGGISTPMVIQWPVAITEKRIEHTPCHVIDIMPTFLDAAGIEYPQEFNGNKIQSLDGESLISSFNQSGWKRETPIFWEHEGNCAYRFGDWKLVCEYEGKWELYDMSCDRTELKDLSLENRPMVEKFMAEFQEWAQQMGVIEWSQLIEPLKKAWGVEDLPND